MIGLACDAMLHEPSNSFALPAFSSLPHMVFAFTLENSLRGVMDYSARVVEWNARSE